jgi:hypothetical protein
MVWRKTVKTISNMKQRINGSEKEAVSKGQALCILTR